MWPILLIRRPRSSACPPRTPRPPPCGTGHAGAVSRVSRQGGVPVSGRVPAHLGAASPAPVGGGEGARGAAERKGQRRTLRPIQAAKGCPNPRCAYFAITDAAIHALVADGHHGQDGSIQNWQCQACGQHASDRFGTFLYRLKKPVQAGLFSSTTLRRNSGRCSSSCNC